jgi:hypothetical protein
LFFVILSSFCVQFAKKNENLYHTLIGDQEDAKTLQSWVKESGGNFDIIVDDGGHHNNHM